MGVALQCPECGFKHRLDAIGDRAVFSCARCSRELKVPAEYRAAAASVTNGSGATPARTGVTRWSQYDDRRGLRTGTSTTTRRFQRMWEMRSIIHDPGPPTFSLIAPSAR